MKKGFILFISILFTVSLFAQSAPDKYLIQFTDKNDSPYSVDNPIEFLSQRSLDRRAMQGIDVIEEDIPVNQNYIDEVLELGPIDLLLKSKWFNTITVYITDISLIEEIEQLSFVSSVKSIKIYNKGKYSDEDIPVLHKDLDPSEYGPSYDQLEEFNGEALHGANYLGDGMLIFVCDAGFTTFETLDAFDHLFTENRIIGTRDFVDGDANVYHGSSHGTKVMGTMAGVLPNELIGTAPQASYYLARTEDVSSEYVIEEDNWIAAAELADSIGADVVTTSLSYTTFDDPSQDHSYEDLDGQTTRIAIGAGIAAQKGMVIVVSAGNYFAQSWHYIGSPADAIGILAIGAMTSDSTHSSFSSAGPSYDGRVKPEVVARGTAAVTVSTGNNGISFANGTSFSGPIIAGISSCLWQAFPNATSVQIRKAIILSAHLYDNPNTEMGYGIPNFGTAMEYLEELLGTPPFIEPISDNVFQRVYPNPFNEYLIIELRAPGGIDDKGRISLISSLGARVYEADVFLEGSDVSRIVFTTPDLAAGVYTLEYIGSNSRETVKLVHL